jgi:3-dehydroquinate synthase
LSHPEKDDLLHGEAIAIGMVLAAYISHRCTDFPMAYTLEIKELLHHYFGRMDIDTSDYQPIMDLMKYDKKNHHGNINFVLLKTMGEPKLDCLVENEIILEAFKFYAAAF